MFDLDKFSKLAEFLKNNFPEHSQNMADAFEWMNIAADDTYQQLSSDAAIAMKDSNLKKARENLDCLNVIQVLQEQSSNLSFLFSSKSLDDELLDDIEEQEFDDESINGDEYIVPKGVQEITTRIGNVFTGSKPYYFIFEGEKYSIQKRYMKTVLLEVASLLAKKDSDIMQSFISDPDMKGREHPIFSLQPIIANGSTINTQVPDTKFYVRTNTSANAIRSILWKMLKKYKINTNLLKIGVEFPKHYKCNAKK